MLGSHKNFLKGLKDLNDLEHNIKYLKVISKGLKDLEDLEQGKYKGIGHDDLISHDDDISTIYDEIIIPDDDELFNKKKINIHVSNNVSLLTEFPNALLLEESIFSKPKNKTDTTKEKSTPKPNPKVMKQDDIWDILDQIKKDNHSETIDDIVSETDAIVCKDCGSTNLTEDQNTSVIVCSDCGMINEEILDHGPEWRQYNNDDNRGEGVNRCGCPSNFFFPKSSQGTIMTGSTSNRLKRKQKWNSMVYKERSLNYVFEGISAVCAKNGLPKIITDTAKILYKNLSDCKHKTGPNAGKQIIIRGDNRLSIIAACVYRACEQNKMPRSVKEIARFFNLDEKKVTKGNKQYVKILKNAEDQAMVTAQLDNNSSAEDFIKRHWSKRIPKEAMDLAVTIANNCCRMKLASDHNPQSIAAGAMLLMVEYSNLNIDKKSIAKLLETTDVTIGKIYHKIAPYADALVDNEATDYLIEKFKING
jgi:transcription initiation factor TFIIB